MTTGSWQTEVETLIRSIQQATTSAHNAAVENIKTDSILSTLAAKIDNLVTDASTSILDQIMPVLKDNVEVCKLTKERLEAMQGRLEVLRKSKAPADQQRFGEEITQVLFEAVHEVSLKEKRGLSVTFKRGNDRRQPPAEDRNSNAAPAQNMATAEATMEEVFDEAPTPAVSATAPVPSVDGLNPSAIEDRPIDFLHNPTLQQGLSQRFERVPEPTLKSLDELKSLESMRTLEPSKPLSDQSSSQGPDW